MAEYYTPEEIQEIFDAYNQAIAAGTPISKEFAQQLKDATLGVKNYTKKLQDSLDALNKSVVSLGKDFYEGKQGASVFNDSISAGANAVADYASKFGPAGKAVGLFTKAVAAYVGAVNKQADELFKSYQDISRVGSIGAGGMQELYVRMQDLGYGVKELGSVVSLLAENSKALATFGGTTTEGTKAFSKLSREIRTSDIGKQLLNAGVSVDEMDRGIAGFLKQQTMLGRGQADMSKSLNKETGEYLQNLEVMARLTGQDRKAMEAKMQDAMNEQAFNRRISKLRASDDEKDREEARKLDALNLTLEGEARKEFLAAQAGDMSRASKLLLTAPEFVAAMRDPSKSAAQALDAFAKGTKQRLDSMGDLALYNAWNDSFINITELQEFQAKYGKQAAQELIDEAVRQSKVTDKGTKNMVTLQEAQRDARDNLQDFVNAGIKPVTWAMKVLAQAISGLTSVIPFAGNARRKAELEDMTQRPMGGLKEKIAGVESGGNYNAKNPKSSASGKYQFTKGTFEGLAKGAAEGSALYGKTWEDYQQDQAVQEAAMDALLDTNKQYLASKGIKPTDSALYLAHWFGPKGAANILNSGPTTNLGSLFGEGVFSANPNISPMMTTQQVMAMVDKKIGGGYANGGIASGPTSGYSATLHGTEAVVPLPDGRNIPVEQVGGVSAAQFTEQLNKLDELVNLMAKQVSLSNKLLTYTS